MLFFKFMNICSNACLLEEKAYDSIREGQVFLSILLIQDVTSFHRIILKIDVRSLHIQSKTLTS